MKRFSSRFSLLTAVLLLLNIYCVNAQLFYSNSANIKINGGGNVYVNGGVMLDNNTTFINEGELSVRNDLTSGNLTINNNSSLSGNGDYRIEKDWINNANFVQGNSRVFLDGSGQLITGNVSTIFHELNLLNASVKRQTLNSGIDITGTLNLNDCELATDQFTMSVENPSPSSVTKFPGNAGFVSSLSIGNLTRATNQPVPYLFPTGSSLGNLIYRPVELKPADNSLNAFSVRLANNNATTDGYNISSFDVAVDCELNDKYYHLINRIVGSANPDITIYHDPINDNFFNGIDQWNTPNVSIWNSLGLVTTLNNFGFSGITKQNWSNFSSKPYVLSKIKPGLPLISGASSFCPSNSELMYVATGGNPTAQYNWTLPSGVNFQTQGNDTIYVMWSNSTPGQISVTENTGSNCSSAVSTLNITPFLNPISNINVVAGENNSGIYQFRDSSISVTSWSWNFGDNSTSSLLI